MRVISRHRLKEFWETPGRPDSGPALRTWFNVASKARWASFAELKRDYGAKVDLAHGKYIFDIHGNRYRLICAIDFVRHGVLALWIGTHLDYDRLNQRGCKGMKEL